MKGIPSIVANKLPGYTTMIDTIKQSPDRILINSFWTEHQNLFWNQKREFWMWIGTRLEYFQFIQLGFLAEDPIVKIKEPWARRVNIYSNYYFHKLQVIIEHWDIIKAVAYEKKREFLFSNPRTLLAQICREAANQQFCICLINQKNVGKTLKDLQKEEVNWLNFHKGSSKLAKNVRDELSNEAFQTPLWYRFPTVAICYRFCKTVRDGEKMHEWKKFCKAHTALYRYLREEADNLWWHYGHPADSKGRPIQEFDNFFWKDRLPS